MRIREYSARINIIIALTRRKRMRQIILLNSISTNVRNSIIQIITRVNRSTSSSIINMIPITCRLRIVRQITSRVRNVFNLSNNIVLVYKRKKITIVNDMMNSRLRVNDLAIFTCGSQLPPLLIGVILCSDQVLVIFQVFIQFGRILRRMRNRKNNPTIIMGSNVTLCIFCVTM